MELLDLMKKRRSIRKFKAQEVNRDDLLNLIEVACFAHSVCNRQSLRYMIVMDETRVDEIFNHSSLGLASKGENGLTGEDFAPPAYILITAAGDPSHIDYADAGASYQNMALMAMQANLGMFWIHSFAGEVLRNSLNLPEDQTIVAILAVGVPAESPVAVNVNPEEKEKYGDSEEKNLKVPKVSSKYLVSWR